MSGALFAVLSISGGTQVGPAFSEEMQLNAPEAGKLRAFFESHRATTPFVSAARRAAPVAGVGPLDPRKSVFITEVDTVKQLTFGDVMQQLVTQGGDPSQTRLSLFHQWFDSENLAPGTVPGPHCTSPGPGFFLQCPRPEGQEAQSDPFTNPDSPDGYTAIAFSNRFDFADPANATQCGEYRVIFARNSGMPPPNAGAEDNSTFNRNLLIFEARLPNPQPGKGLSGCLPVQNFWRSLSDSMTPTERGQKLRGFYLNGLPDQGVGPVVTVDNYGFSGGQIRTNQFLHQKTPSVDWTLREFKIQKLSPGIRIVPVTDKESPDVTLFDGTAPIDLQSAFIARLSDVFDGLRGGSPVNEDSQNLTLHLDAASDDKFNGLESDEIVDTRGSVVKAFKADGLVGTYLTEKIAELKRTNATALTPADVVQRIQTQTCAGCHQWSSNKPLGAGAGNFPPSLGFVQVSEKNADIESGPEGPRHKISDLLKSPEFIPVRCQLIADFIGASPAQCNNN